MNRYEVILHFRGGEDLKVVLVAKDMDEAIAKAKRESGNAPATTSRRL